MMKEAKMEKMADIFCDIDQDGHGIFPRRDFLVGDEGGGKFSLSL